MDAISGIQAPAFSSSIADSSSIAEQNNFGINESLNPDEASLGDKFFQILSDTKQEISEKTNQIESSLSVKDISPVDLIRLQFELAEITIQQELISKGVSKSTQNVDTLLKAQ